MAALMLRLAAATLISEDLASITAGLLAAEGRMPLWAAIVACAVGIFVGDMLLFVAGRTLGQPALRVPPLSWWLDERAVEAASIWFRRRGAATVFVTRFLPGARLPVYFAAGVLHTGFWRFAGYFALAVALWTPLLVGLAAAFGTGALQLLGRARLGLAALLAAAVVLALLVRGVLLPSLTHRGRQRLAARWRRCRRRIGRAWPRGRRDATPADTGAGRGR